MNKIRNRIKWEMEATKLFFGRVFRNLIINSCGGSYIVPGFIRKLIYNLCGMKVATRDIFPKCFFGGTNIEIGKGSFINYGCYFDGSERVIIKENVNIAMKCTFITSSHEIATSKHRAGKTKKIAIIVEDGCWIGAESRILPGVRIGKGCVIGAGSVVTSDCEDNCLYVGIPARKVRKLEP